MKHDMTQKETASLLADRIRTLHEDLGESHKFAVELVKARLTDIVFDLMETQGVTNADLADRLNVSRPYISKLLRGDVNFTLDTLVKIARALNQRINVEDFFVPIERTASQSHPWRLSLVSEPIHETVRRPATTEQTKSLDVPQKSGSRKAAKGIKPKK